MDLSDAKKVYCQVKDDVNRKDDSKRYRFYIDSDEDDLYFLFVVDENNKGFRLDLDDKDIEFDLDVDINCYSQISQSQFEQIVKALPEQLRHFFEPYISSDKDQIKEKKIKLEDSFYDISIMDCFPSVRDADCYLDSVNLVEGFSIVFKQGASLAADKIKNNINKI